MKADTAGNVAGAPDDGVGATDDIIDEDIGVAVVICDVANTGVDADADAGAEDATDDGGVVEKMDLR